MKTKLGLLILFLTACSPVLHSPPEVAAKAFTESQCDELHTSSYGIGAFYENSMRSCHGGKLTACSIPPPAGEIVVIDARYGEIKGCTFWRAQRSEGQGIVDDFDAFETHRPEVVYRSTGTYPVWTQKIVHGGCPPGGTTCGPD